jgi:hypothetical protein
MIQSSSRNIFSLKQWPFGLLAFFVLCLSASCGTIAATDYEIVRFTNEGVACYLQDGKSCSEKVALSAEYSYSTLSKNDLVTVDVGGPAFLVINLPKPISDAAAVGGAFIYRANGLLRPNVAFTSDDRGQRPWEWWRPEVVPTEAQKAFGTTPGYIWGELTAADRSGNKNRLIWRIEKTFGPSQIAFGPILTWRSRFVDDVWKNGWIGVFATWPWCLGLIASVGLGLWSCLFRREGKSVLRLGSLQSAFVACLFVSFSVPFWYWLPWRAIQLYSPAPWAFQGSVGYALKSMLEALWPSGVIVNTVGTQNLDALAARLNTIATGPYDAFLIGAAGFILTVVLSSAVPLRSLPKNDAPERAPTSVALAIGFFLLAVLVLLETWRMPIGSPGVVLVGVATIFGIVILTLILARLDRSDEVFSFDNSHVPSEANIWLGVSIAAIYFVARISDLFLPGTILTDETFYYSGQFVLLGAAYTWLKKTNSVVHIAVLLGASAALTVLIWSFIRCSRTRFGWVVFIAFAFFCIVFVVATAHVPISSSDALSMFRYPPLVQLSRFIPSTFPAEPLTAARLTSLFASAVSVGLFFLLLRALGVALVTAILGCGVFLASHIIYYYSIINGDTFQHVAGTLAVMIVIVIWLESADPRLLRWATAATLLTFFFRQSAVELIPVIVLTVISALLFDRRFRNRQTVLSLLFYLLGTLIPILLYQKGLVGSWFEPANPTLSWLSIWASLHDEPARWFAEAWTFDSSGGFLTSVAFLLAAGAYIPIGRNRLAVSFLLYYFVFDLVLQHFFQRGIAYHGYDRLLVPLHIPIVATIIVVLDDCSRRTRSIVGPACAFALLLVVIKENRYSYEPVQCVKPLEFAPLSQYNGQPFFFSPEDKLMGMLPDGVRPSDVALVFVGHIATKGEFGRYTGYLGSQASLHAKSIEDGKKYLAVLVPTTDECIARVQFVRDHVLTPEASYLSDPKSKLNQQFFRFVATGNVEPLEIQIYEVLPNR